MTNHVPPTFGAVSFHCSHCNTVTTHTWCEADLHHRVAPHVSSHVTHLDPSKFSWVICQHCHGYTIWHDQKMIYPDGGNVPPPHHDMPAEVAADYNEARTIVLKSPRGAAALLRLAIQELMPHLGEKGEKIDTDIKNLVQKGLPIQIQQALDTVRVIGNESVHPGELDLRDDPDTATVLFDLLNLIVEEMIERPKAINSIYNKLPQSKLDAIKKRDGK